MAKAQLGARQPFPYPPMHSFPPFFTLQRNAQTLASQLSAWSKCVLSFCEHYRIFMLDAEGGWQRRAGVDVPELFGNATIDRHLSDEAIKIVFKSMVEKRQAVWVPALPRPAKGIEQTGNSVLVLWHSPEEWGELIAGWINKTGQNGSIMTFFELTEGDLVQGEEFADIPIPLLRLALATLERKGKARVFEGSEATAEGMAGVKFT